MIIYKKNSEELVIPVGLGPNVSPITGYELQMKRVDSSTELQHVEPDASYYGLYRVIVDPYELDSKTVDASTEAQVITSSKDGLFQVIVNPYTLESRSQTITQNGEYSFTPDNKDGLSRVDISVNVADIPAVVQTKSVTYTENGEYSVEPDEGYDGLSHVDVSVNVEISPELQEKTVDPSVSEITVEPDSGYDGLSSVTINPIDSSLDPDLSPENIKKDVEIFGVTGTYEGQSVNNQSKTVDSSTTIQYVQPDEGYTGLDYVAVNPYTLESKSETITTSGQYTYTATNADGLSEVTVDVSINDSPELQSKTVDSSTTQQIVQADSNYDGLSQVVVEPYTLDSKTVNPSTNQQIITSDADGLSQVTVNAMNLQYVVYNDYEHSAQNWVFSPSTGYDGMSYVRVAKPYVKQVEVNSSTNQQVITPSDWYCDLFGKVTIYPYTTETDSSTLTQNGQYVFTPQNADALSQVTIDVSVAGQQINNQNKTVDSSTVSQSVSADNGYTGLGTVTVNPYTTETDSSTLTANGTYTFTPQNADALSQVTVNVSVNSSSNTEWVIQARRGITTDASNVSLTANRQLCYSHLCYGASGLVGLPLIADTTLPYLASYELAFYSCPVGGNVTIPNLTQITGTSALSGTFHSTHITGVNFPALQDVSASNGLGSAFANCKSLTDASFPNLISIKGFQAAVNMFGDDSSLANISFPSLEEINGEEAAQLMFHDCSSLTSVSFPSLETIYGLNAAQNMFQNCTSLTSASFPELQFVDEPNEVNVCGGMFDGCSAYETLYVPKLEATESNRMCIGGICGGYDNIRTLTCKPSFATSQRSRLQGLENLTLTGSITTDFDLQYSGNLTPQSILNVLQAIDTTVQSPGGVYFYHEGLMVNDFQDGRIRTAYDTAVAAGWTIQNLLFIDPSQYTRVDYIESTGQTLNLGNTLGRYDAVYADYEMTAGDGGIFIGTDGTGAYKFGFGTDGLGTLREHYGTNGEDVFYGGSGFNTRYQGCMGIYTDDVGGWTWSDFSYGETYPAYNIDDYNGSGSNVLRFADAGNYGKIRSIKVYTNLTWAVNINFDINYNIMFYDSPIYNYIPLKRLSDNAYGLYETTTGVFYTAQGITGGMDNNS